MLDKQRSNRQRQSGDRLHDADQERSAALDELKDAMADGDSEPEEASDLTGMPETVSAAMMNDDFRE